MAGLYFVSHHYHVFVASPYMSVFFFFFRENSKHDKGVVEGCWGCELLATPGFLGSKNMLVWFIML